MARRPSDKPATILRVVRGGYEPASPYDAEIHARFTLGSEVEAVISQNKSNEQLRLYWGYLKFVVDATGRHGNARSLSNSLLSALGYVESFTALMGGGTHVHPMSIAEMEAPDFNEFCTKAFAVVWEEFGIDVDQYKAHLRAKGSR